MKHVINKEEQKPKEKLTIGDYFVEDHKLILSLAHSGTEREADLDEVLKKLDWHSVRHFYIEEKALYSFIEATGINPEFMDEFLGQHNSLLKFKDELIHHLKEKSENAKQMFIKFIAKVGPHVSYEIENVYSFLEENLNPEQKEKLVGEIKKSISLGFYPIDKLRSYYREKLKIDILPL